MRMQWRIEFDYICSQMEYHIWKDVILSLQGDQFKKLDVLSILKILYISTTKFKEPDEKM